MIPSNLRLRRHARKDPCPVRIGIATPPADFTQPHRLARSADAPVGTRRSCRWESTLPPETWLIAADRLVRCARLLRRMGVTEPRYTLILLRLSARLSRAGFVSWRLRKGTGL